MVVTMFGTVIVARRVQFLNAIVPILVTEAGIVTLVRFVQPSNKPATIVVIAFERVIPVIPVHP